MDRHQRLAILAEAAADDREHGLAKGRPGDPVGITKVRLPGGGCTNIMRIMQTNACSLSCGYCPTFCGGEVKGTGLGAGEGGADFIGAPRGGARPGAFPPLGSAGQARARMDRMLAAVETLRRKEGYRGYVHVKLLPGAEPAQVEAAARLANRVSINLEGPGDSYVRRLARDKDFSGPLLPRLKRAGLLPRGAPGGVKAPQPFRA